MAVAVVSYDPTWPDRFAQQQQALSKVLAPLLAGPVEHIGSTAVPGLRAKPVIDVLAPVHSLAAARTEALPLLAEHDWVFWPADPAEYRLWFLRPAPERRTHHLQIIERGDPHALALVAFRDALRADPELRREYAELKDKLARQHAGNRNAYTNAKADFITAALARAGIHMPPRDLLPE